VLVLQGKLDEASRALVPTGAAFVSLGLDGLPGLIMAGSGRPDDARREIARLEHLPRLRYDGIALLYLTLGDRERALAALDREVQERSTGLPFLAVAPLFDALHGDPHFQRILGQLHLK
jgi:hypothetical protein